MWLLFSEVSLVWYLVRHVAALVGHLARAGGAEDTPTVGSRPEGPRRAGCPAGANELLGLGVSIRLGQGFSLCVFFFKKEGFGHMVLSWFSCGISPELQPPPLARPQLRP